MTKSMTGLRFCAVALTLMSLAQCDRIRSALHPAQAQKQPYASKIHLELTPVAAERMKANAYHLNVHAFYYGHAKTPKAPGADELNRIELGYELNGFGGEARLLSMGGDGIDTGLFPRISESGPSVLITVLAVNKSNFENEALVCQNYIGLVSEIQTRPAVIKCHGQSEAGFPPS